ncbi:MAG: hypothetical protein ACPL1D_01315 [Microgenomates group bacterium]
MKDARVNRRKIKKSVGILLFLFLVNLFFILFIPPKNDFIIILFILFLSLFLSSLIFLNQKKLFFPFFVFLFLIFFLLAFDLFDIINLLLSVGLFISILILIK